VAVEAIHDNKNKAYYSVLASLLPNAPFYDPSRVGNPKQDTVSFTEPEFSEKASTDASYLLGEDSFFKGIVPKVGMSVLFDIKAYLPDKDKFVDYGYAVAPIFTTMDADHDGDANEFYVSSGIFSLPVFEGRPTQNIIDILKQ
jgi:hypothetical protein